MALAPELIQQNLNRGLRYVPVNLINAKLIVFLGFILMLVNKSTDVNNTFIIYSNSVLASKIYSIVNGLPIVSLVIYIDSYSLYECLVKLGTTKKKRLIINIMALRHKDNPTDDFTMALPNRALEQFINSNKVIV
ncbi:hypothetical protein BU23DRAFT_576114 [Bimuria novae-zelandiae CBS 107.79]|uniref:Uncharacterized protein n=1 Tax=Bimuria novae-zelandiae CBS 107.79 TaxID=1447943 RepID=A0A6A5VYL0_9PLEO|nr:hypothetical protein BU23DRAFT_576114 [Bimuria novae-zelandiae CBS 107.79]